MIIRPHTSVVYKTAHFIQVNQSILLLNVLPRPPPTPPKPLTKYRQNMYNSVLNTTDNIYFTLTLNIFSYCKINVFIYLAMKAQLSIMHLQYFHPSF